MRSMVEGQRAQRTPNPQPRWRTSPISAILRPAPGATPMPHLTRRQTLAGAAALAALPALASTPHRAFSNVRASPEARLLHP